MCTTDVILSCRRSSNTQGSAGNLPTSWSLTVNQQVRYSSHPAPWEITIKEYDLQIQQHPEQDDWCAYKSFHLTFPLWHFRSKVLLSDCRWWLQRTHATLFILLSASENQEFLIFLRLKYLSGRYTIEKFLECKDFLRLRPCFRGHSCDRAALWIIL